MMNCHKATQQIPLFVEDDLNAAEMQQVNLHLEACPACRAIAAEFQSSQSSLRAVSVAVFDEEMLIQMRRAVNAEIARTSVSVFAGVSPIWNWRLACAAAVLVCVSSFVLYSQFKLKSEPAVNDVATLCCDTGSVSDLNLRQSVPNQSVGRSRSPYRNRIRVASPAKQVARTLPVTPPDEVNLGHPVEAVTVPSSLAIAEPQPEVTTSAPEPEMLRMEFQTADPNIKIIWLTPKEPARTTPAADIQ